ncbi:MAG: DUF885 domain-containing protein [Pirellulales bacterium]
MASEQLERLFSEAWEAELADDPLLATHFGLRRYNDRLPRVTLSDHQRRLGQRQALVERLRGIDRSGLSPSERISYDIFGRLKQDEIAEHQFQTHLMPITNRSGFHISFPDLPKDVPLDTVEDYENYIARLRDFARYTDEHIELMREGIRQELTLPAVVLAGYDEPIRAQIVDDPKRSLLYEPFQEFPTMVPDDEHQRLARQGQQAILQSVVPAYQRFLDFMREEYVPAARGEVGASALPEGREFYRHRVRQFTTLDLEPQQVHDVGLAEVARIKAEMHEVIRRSGFEGDFAAFVEFLRTDPRFYVDTPEQLMKEVAVVLKRMDGELPRLFQTLPRLSYGIREVPKFIAPSTTTAYYSPGAGDGSRAGFYYVNTYNLKSRPLYEIEALSLHEAVPGHHLQIARQQELEGVPDFQRFAGFTAFVEGWALYAERLGLETGFYQDPYSDFGRLSYEMWRACRLVVDTGMHYLGWSREQAIQFMADNTALTRHNITTEVDRYIAWPGQALAYKIGELKIRELRGMAEERLGTRFDIREFHDVVLGSGAVPLEVLERIVTEYCEQRTKEEE